MAREILFKAKRIDNGEWVEGLLWKKKYQSSKWFISCFPDKDDNEEVYVIDINTLCQYTGLIDKNGNKIFDRDILVFIERATHPIKVYWDGLGWKFLRNGKNIEDAFECNTIKHIRSCEVVGNIFDMGKEDFENGC